MTKDDLIRELHSKLGDKHAIKNLTEIPDTVRNLVERHISPNKAHYMESK